MALGDYRYILTSAGGPNVKKQFYRLWWGAADQCAVSRVTRSSGGNTSSNTQVLMEWRGCASAMGVMKLPPTVLVQKPLCNQFISYYYMCSCWVCGINHFKLRDFAVAALDSLQPLIKVVQWPGYIDGPWRSVVARRLNLWRPSTSVISIGMEHLFLVTLLFVPEPINNKYIGGCKIYFNLTCQVFFFTFGPRGRRARSVRPRGQNVAAIALDMGQAHLWYENNTMQTIHAIQTLRTVCGFLDMGDGCCLIFNKNQLMFIVIKSITAQIKKKISLFFS